MGYWPCYQSGIPDIFEDPAPKCGHSFSECKTNLDTINYMHLKNTVTTNTVHPEEI